MKKLLILTVLCGGGFFAYQKFFAISKAYATYEKFSDAMLHDRWDEAEELAQGRQVKRRIARARRAPDIIGYETYRGLKGFIHWGPVRDPVSEIYSKDGTRVTLTVTQDLRRGSVTMAPVGPATIRHHQTVTLVNSGDTWLVEEFYDEIERLSDR